MSESDEHPITPQPTPDEAADAAETPPTSRAGAKAVRRRGGIFGVLSQIRDAGREVAAIARGKPLESPGLSDDSVPVETPTRGNEDKSTWRVNMLHAATERMRGAADSYIAAKLDEIEARVDAKLDHVEGRIDGKIAELHEQLRQMRDRELRHRLRLLKITLIFTVLVAVLSLGYKLLTKYLMG